LGWVLGPAWGCLVSFLSLGRVPALDSSDGVVGEGEGSLSLSPG